MAGQTRMPGAALDFFREYVSGTPQARLYAVLDCARDRRIYTHLMEDAYECRCLLDAPMSMDLRRVAPYLVELEWESGFTPWLFQQGWGKNWGIFICCALELEELRIHLNRLVYASDEMGYEFVFRFYDPRVLRVYLPSCVKNERWYIFRSMDAWFAENDGGGAVLRYIRDNQELKIDEIQLM